MITDSDIDFAILLLIYFGLCAIGAYLIGAVMGINREP